MTVSIQLGAPEEDHNPSNLIHERVSSVRAVEGVAQVQADGTTRQAGVSHYNSMSTMNGETGIVGTARTKTGSPRTSAELQPTDVVRFNGMELTVQSAERAGFIVKDAAGWYTDNVAGQQPEAPPEEREDPGVALSDQTAEADLASLVGGTSGLTQIGALNELIEGGEVNGNTLTRAASELGIHPSELGGRIGSIVDAFRAQAVQTVESMGATDAEAFFDWARENKPRALQEAMRQHGLQRSVEGYKPLYRTYVEHLDEIDPEAVLSAQYDPGVTASRSGKTIVLTIPGHGQMSYRAAVRAGLVGVRRA